MKIKEKNSSRPSKVAFEELVGFLKDEEKIMQSRVNLKSLLGLYKNKKAYFCFSSDIPVAFAGLWSTKSKEWLEFGTLWVNPNFRGMGFSLEAFEECISLAPPKKNIFLITRSKRVMDIAKSYGWFEWKSQDWTKDSLWQKIAEPWGKNEKLPKATRMFPSGGRLFIKP